LNTYLSFQSTVSTEESHVT